MHIYAKLIGATSGDGFPVFSMWLSWGTAEGEWQLYSYTAELLDASKVESMVRVVAAVVLQSEFSHLLVVAVSNFRMS